jgi:hypothetical protein
MKLKLLIALFILSVAQLLQAARPTVNASNFTHTYITCVSAELKWSNGNGNARMIVAREGSPVAFVPSDNTIYSNVNPNFGASSPVGNSGNEYVIFNGVGTGTLSVAQLKSGITYYFTIYEHDNNGSSTQYLTSGVATYSAATHYINMNFSVSVIDSCEGNNKFVFTNTSVSSILGLQDSFSINGKRYNADQPLTYSFKNTFGKPTLYLINNNQYGCPTTTSKQVKIIPKKMVKFDFLNSSDTVQDYIGNIFNIRTTSETAPFPMSVSCLWYSGDGDSSFFFTFRKSYQNTGRFHTRLITSASINLKPTGCKDTMYLDLVVTGIKPFRNLQITPDFMELKDNLFSFSLSDTGLSAVKWYFGDGDSSDQAVTTHSYKDIGTYKVKVKATTKGGKSAISSKDLIVFSRTTDIKSNTEKNIAILKAYPNPASTVLHLSFKELDNYTILVYQADGKLILSSEQKSLEERLELNELVSGIHHIEILKNGIHQQGFNIFIDK